MLPSFLETFQQFCSDEDEYYLLIASDRYEHNYSRMMKKLHKRKQNPAVMARYQRNIAAAQKLMEEANIVHNTDLEALLGILKEGRLLSEDRLLFTDFHYNSRCSLGGDAYRMMDYVTCTTFSGSFLNGLYRIQFNEQLENKNKACFIPRSHICYEKNMVEDNMMELSHWREYMSEYIAVNAGKDVSAFLNSMQLSQKPDLLFPRDIKLYFIEQIHCATFKAYQELVEEAPQILQQCRVSYEAQPNHSEPSCADGLSGLKQDGRGRLQVIAVQKPFISDDAQRVHCLVVLGEAIYLYTRHQDLIWLGKYRDIIEDVCHVISEDKYEWADFPIQNGDTVQWEPEILFVNEFGQLRFEYQTCEDRQPVSEKSLRIFNRFLKTVNQNNPKMIHALEESLDDGNFRKEVENIIADDDINSLDTTSKEIIIRTKYEGMDYIRATIKKTMTSGKPDRYIRVNHFFRNLFGLEAFGYVTVHGIIEEDPC